MRKIEIGNSGLKASRIGLGTLAFGHKTKGIQDRELIHEMINHALDNGISLIDTAEEYSGGLTEKYIGDTLEERGDREDIILVSKVSHNHLNFKDVIKSAEKSLARLKTDYIDIYLVHWPWCYSPISETMKAMDRLLAEGKILHVGVSNFPNALLQEAEDCLENGRIIVNELEYSMANRSIEKEILPFVKKRKMSVLAYYPLLSGFLTGNYDENTVFPENDFRNNWGLFSDKENFARAGALFGAMREIAGEHGVSPAEVAINWILKDDSVIPIPGAKTITQIESNIHATQWELTKDEYARLMSVTENLELSWG